MRRTAAPRAPAAPAARAPATEISERSRLSPFSRGSPGALLRPRATSRTTEASADLAGAFGFSGSASRARSTPSTSRPIRLRGRQSAASVDRSGREAPTRQVVTSPIRRMCSVSRHFAHWPTRAMSARAPKAPVPDHSRAARIAGNSLQSNQQLVPCWVSSHPLRHRSACHRSACHRPA